MDQEAEQGIREKLSRADEHLKRLADELRAFFDTEPHTYRTDADYEAGSYSVRIEIKAKPPLAVSVTCGDFIHCLRCALEHLVGAEVPHNTRKTAFPLCKTKTEFFTDVMTPAWKSSQGPLTGLDPEGQLFAYIQSVQPYRGQHGHTHHPLWLLGDLSNADKHRAIFATATSHRQFQEPSLAFEGTDIEYTGQAELRYDKPLKDGDEVLSGCFRVTGPNPHVHVHGHFPIEVAFGEELVTSEGLDQIRKAVWQTLGNAFAILGLPPL
ncbi:MAG TPA: hypothetical protein VL988_11430 [Solirubrobacteraceae bacterium]|nr:hypothetical protein [Solirubrobacteraceae bacterium]